MPLKEAQFFTRKWDKGRIWYESLFSDCPNGMICGEYSTTYLTDTRAAHRIHAYYPEAKLIAVLRNPVERAISHFRFLVRYGKTTEKSIEEENDVEPKHGLIANGLYCHPLSVWKKWCGENLLLIDYEELLNEPEKVLKRVYRHVGVNDSFIPSILHSRINPGGVTRNARLDRMCLKLAALVRERWPFKLFWWHPKFIRVRYILLGKGKEIIISKSDVEFLERVYEEDWAKSRLYLS